MNGLRNKEQIVELSVFLFLIVPSMIFSFFLLKQARDLGFPLLAVSVLVRDLALVSLVLFFLWRNGEPFGRIGWRPANIAKEIVLGFWLFIPFFFGTGLVALGLQKAGLSIPATPLTSLMAGKSAFEYLLATVLVLVVAVSEETIFRGYLILRFRNLTTTAGAVLASSAIFSLGHGYEGAAGVIVVGIMGIVFGLIYLWRKSLVAPIVMHFLQDFLGLILVPLLGQK